MYIYTYVYMCAYICVWIYTYTQVYFQSLFEYIFIDINRILFINTLYKSKQVENQSNVG